LTDNLPPFGAVPDMLDLTDQTPISKGEG
jgi:hypothetical protein